MSEEGGRRVASTAVSEGAGERTGVSPVALLLGLALCPGVSFIVAYAELVVAQMQVGILQFPPAVIGVFLFLTGVNALLRRVSRRLALTPAEMVVIYCMMLMASMITSRGLMEKWLPPLVSTNYFSSAANRWMEIFGPHLKAWAVAFDPLGEARQPAASGFYEGLWPGERFPWRAWARPLAAWSVVIGCIFFAFLCLATILRRQWVDHEKLTFPLTLVPLELATGGRRSGLFRSILLYAGMLPPVFVFTLNGLHEHYPRVPWLPLEHNVNQLFLYRPWTDMDGTTAYLSFAAVGFAYFIPTDILLSLWLFFVLGRLGDVVMSAFGYRMEGMPLYPGRMYRNYQVLGAYVVLFAYQIRTGAPLLRQVVRKAVGRARALDDGNELLPYGVAFWGLLASTLGAIVWCRALGMSWVMAVIEIVVYLFLVVVVMARSVAEGGVLMTETSFRPVDLVPLVTSKARLGAPTLTALALTDAVFTRDLRGLLVTGFLDGLKMSDGVGMRRRALLLPLVSSVVVSVVAACAIMLWISYKWGGTTLYYYAYRGNSLWTFSDAQAAMSAPVGRHPVALPWFLVGLVVAGLSATMRTRFSWWPLHVLGYAMMSSWTMYVLWFPMFVAWVVKGVVLRYGGGKMFRQLRPAFVGLILGEFGMAAVWATYSALTRRRGPFFPWP